MKRVVLFFLFILTLNLSGFSFYGILPGMTLSNAKSILVGKGYVESDLVQNCFDGKYKGRESSITIRIERDTIFNVSFWAKYEDDYITGFNEFYSLFTKKYGNPFYKIKKNDPGFNQAGTCAKWKHGTSIISLTIGYGKTIVVEFQGPREKLKF